MIKQLNNFGIGYAPTGSICTSPPSSPKGIPEKLLSKSGLFYEKKDRKEMGLHLLRSTYYTYS